MREGALYRHLLPEPHLVPDVRAFGSRTSFAAMPSRSCTLSGVVELSLSLFDELAEIHRLDLEYRELLGAAGQNFTTSEWRSSYNRHHKHGACCCNFFSDPRISATVSRQ